MKRLAKAVLNPSPGCAAVARLCRVCRAIARRPARPLAAGLLGWALAAGMVGAHSTEASPAQAVAILNRIGFGPSPADLQHVEHIGVDAYIDEQLQPQRLALPQGLSQRLSGLDTMQLQSAQLIEEFRDAQREAKEAAARNDQARNDQAHSGQANDASTAAPQPRRLFVRRLSEQAAQARFEQAVDSPRQLQEVMVDFWFNHFNVYAGKGLDRVLVAAYERDAIRPYALGHFRELLGATAHHAAMLFYLDNWLSSAPGYQPSRLRQGKAQAAGLNENYARELMELHTLGVDAGYTQRDVTELARVFTGWTINPRRGEAGSAFYFDARRHDDGDKEWLGYHVASRGQAEGEWALDILAAHPATAHHIAYELAQYFVDDAPPTALVDQLAKRYLATDGDIREVLRTLFHSAAFRQSLQAPHKFKTPYQYVVSALRAAGVHDIDNVRPLLATLNRMGMPLYGCQTPDGYKNVESAWLNADALDKRVAFATALATGKLRLQARPADHEDSASASMAGMPAMDRPVDAQALQQLLGDSLSPHTLQVVDDAPPALRAAMILGGPDFMRR